MEILGDFDSEVCDFATELAAKNWPQVSLLGNIELISENQITDIVESLRDRTDIILLIGGFPCKDTSRLKFGRKNLHGSESSKFQFFVRLLEWVRLAAGNIPVKFLLENTVMDEAPMRQISAALSCKPLRIEAGAWLACTRPRLYWCNWEMVTQAGESILHSPHVSTLLLPRAQDVTNILEEGWVRHRNLENNFRCATGYRPARQPPPRPVGLVGASQSAKARWTADDFATQVYHYEDKNLAWPGNSSTYSHQHHRCFKEGGRLLSCEELERALGFPTGYTDPRLGSHHQIPSGSFSPDVLYQKRRNAIGNSFAVPVVGRLLRGLLLVLGFNSGLGSVESQTLERARWPFPFQNSALSDLREEAKRTSAAYAWLLSDFHSFAQDKGFNTFGLGSDPGLTWDPAGQQAALGIQRAMHLSKFGADLLVAHNGTMEAHIDEAFRCQHPYKLQAQLALDMDFGLAMLQKLGSGINKWRKKQQAGWISLAADCGALDARIRERSHPDTLRVTSKVRSGFLLVLTELFEWPDWALGDRFTWGFPIAGFVPPTNVYGEAKQKGEQTSLTSVLGESADAWNLKLCRDTKQFDTDSVIWESTVKEQKDGKLSSFFSKAQLDTAFGKGQWRAVRRRTIWQEGKNKYRNIDNARKSGHNSASLLLDTICTTPFDISANLLIHSRQRLGLLADHWKPGLSSDDQKDAYHTIPNLFTQLGLCVIAVLDTTVSPPVTRFCASWGHVFGFKSAVVNYNRVPEFLVAVCRRAFATLTWHFFDDVGNLSFMCDKETSVPLPGFVFSSVGLPANPDKHEPWSQALTHLGVVHDLTNAENDTVQFSPKPGRVSKIVGRCSASLAAKQLPSGDAASLRGELGHLFCSSFDKIGKCGLRALADQQYGNTSGWPRSLELSLEFFASTLPALQPRVINLGGIERCRNILYTDASWEIRESDDTVEWISAGLGAILFSDAVGAQAWASQLPQRWIPLMNPRKTQIVMCEALAVLDTVTLIQEQLRGSELLLFIDNIAVVCALVKGTSSHSDIQQVVTQIHVVLAKVGCAWYVEWVPSALNCADGPSRDGLKCPWCAKHGIQVRHLVDSDWQPIGIGEMSRMPESLGAGDGHA